MSFCVVTEPCRDCKYTDCVAVCPVDCFYQDERMLYIDPEDCIDCGACIPECPVSAIFSRADVPPKWESYVALNSERVTVLKNLKNGVEQKGEGLGHITEKQPPLLGAGCAGM